MKYIFKTHSNSWYFMFMPLYLFILKIKFNSCSRLWRNYLYKSTPWDIPSSIKCHSKEYDFLFPQWLGRYRLQSQYGKKTLQGNLRNIKCCWPKIHRFIDKERKGTIEDELQLKLAVTKNVGLSQISPPICCEGKNHFDLNMLLTAS